MSSELCEKYPQLHSYFEIHVMPNEEAWASAYRCNLPVRGNNTQNYVEAQFRVLKDEIVHRVRCYNSVELIEKVTVDLENHYRNKFLTVSNGSFDGIYSSKYLRKGKINDIDCHQISILNEDLEQYVVAPSAKTMKSNPEASNYIVDNATGFCSCKDGEDGSLCKHQFAVLKKYSLSSPNILPVFSPADRQMYATVATGRSLALCYYLGLQEKVSNLSVSDHSKKNFEEKEDKHQEEHNENDFAGHSDNVIEEDYSDNIIEEDNQTMAHAREAVTEIHSKLMTLVDKADPQLLSGIIKMKSRLERLSSNQISSAMHCFGSEFLHTKGKSNKTKAKKGRIRVQPTAVERRKKSQSKTHQMLPKEKSVKLETVINLPNNSNYSRKRRHCFSENVSDNVAVAKKAGRNMTSRTRPLIKCRVKTLKSEESRRVKKLKSEDKQ